MNGYVDGSMRLFCDYCYARSERGPDRDIPVKPKGWGVGIVAGRQKVACRRHVKRLRAEERGDG